MLQFYHYTSLSNYQRMQLRSNFRMVAGAKQPVLETGRSMIAPFERYGKQGCLSYNSAIFGVLEPEPENWCRKIHPTGAPVLEVVIDNLYSLAPVYQNSIVLLEVNVGQDDPVYVADWGVHLDDTSPCGYQKSTKRAYAESLVPMQEYLDNSMNYTLPEVVCFRDIPLAQTRMVLMDNQDRVIDSLREKYGHPPSAFKMEMPEYTCPIAFD